jgi:RNA polymerase sigma-70 factor (ECF subfamily)
VDGADLRARARCEADGRTLAQVARLGGSFVTTELNGQPRVMLVDEEGRIAAVMSLKIADDVVQTIRGITNPDKLAHLGTVADLRAILRPRASASATS